MSDADHRLAEEVRAYLVQAFGADGAAPPAVTAARAVSEREAQLAAAYLCLLTAHADHECRQDEHRAMMRAIERLLGLGPDDTARVLRGAEEQMALSPPLFQFVDLIDRAYSRERKCLVVECLWRVAFADAELAAHEEYLVRKIADLLHLTTADLVATKVRAREGFDLES
jgi:uncharacterized tellurite resistance protein B-like protein